MTADTHRMRDATPCNVACETWAYNLGAHTDACENWRRHLYARGVCSFKSQTFVFRTLPTSTRECEKSLRMSENKSTRTPRKHHTEAASGMFTCLTFPKCDRGCFEISRTLCASTLCEQYDTVGHHRLTDRMRRHRGMKKKSFFDAWLPRANYPCGNCSETCGCTRGENEKHIKLVSLVHEMSVPTQRTLKTTQALNKCAGQADFFCVPLKPIIRKNNF